MERRILAYRNTDTGGYAVMTVWVNGDDLPSIGRTEKIMDFETMDDVKKMRDVLNDMVERWGNV